MHIRPLSPALAVMLAVAGQSAVAADPGKFIVRGGYAVVAPQSSSDETTVGLGDVARVDDGNSLGISLTYMLRPDFGVEVLGALPFSHDIRGTGALSGVDIGKTRHLPPTISLQWYPQVAGNFHPYLGAGLNYTVFFGEKTTSEFTAAVAGLAPGTTSTDLKLDDSFGLALQAGCDYRINDRWSLNAAVWNIDIETEADISANGAHLTTVDVQIDPWVYMIGAGYRF